MDDKNLGPADEPGEPLRPRGFRPGIGADQTIARTGRAPRYLLQELIEELRTTDFTAPPDPDPTRMGEIVTKAQSVARRLIGIVLHGQDRNAVEAAKLVFSYVEGLPVQPVEFDISKVVTQIAEARNLSEADKARAIEETRRVIREAQKAGLAG